MLKITFGSLGRLWVGVGIAATISGVLVFASPSSRLIDTAAHRKISNHRTSGLDVIAYGLVSPLCNGCASPPKGFTPLVSARSQGVLIGSPQVTPQSGVWCFKLTKSVKTSTIAVVASTEGSQSTELPGSHSTSISSTEWVAGGPSCETDEIEIRTMRYEASSSGLMASTADDIPFSFVVLG